MRWKSAVPADAKRDCRVATLLAMTIRISSLADCGTASTIMTNNTAKPDSFFEKSAKFAPFAVRHT